MVYLSRIYTRTGDGGETSLGDGSRVPKDDPRVAAYGTVDELNAFLGLVLADPGVPSEHRQLLDGIQNDLFDMGADLCRPQDKEEKSGQHLRVQAGQVLRLEKTIDQLNASLQPLTTFVLPGGSGPAAGCHLARTVCRRAEREVIALARMQSVNPQVIIYLNRLSDLLFVLARVLNRNGQDDRLWQPGKGQ